MKENLLKNEEYGRFLQLHILTPYAPSNLNRDDLGKPKSAIFGGTNRLRISSQCLKRTWRTSEVFTTELSGSIGFRTRNLQTLIIDELKNFGISDEDELNQISDEWINKIYAGNKEVKEKPKKKNVETGEETPYETNKIEIIHISPVEIENIKKLIHEGKLPKDVKQSEILYQSQENTAVDIALFGRMLAKSTDYNIESATQISHAITTHMVTGETDYFTAVDDLNNFNTGSAHLGEFEFGSGLFYHYICINRELLIQNLNGNIELANKSIQALLEAIITTSPHGKQNSFAALSRAAYVLAETGNKTPRSLSMAFFNAVSTQDLLKGSVDALIECRNNIDKIYGQTWSKSQELNVMKLSGSLSELKKFVAE